MQSIPLPSETDLLIVYTQADATMDENHEVMEAGAGEQPSYHREKEDTKSPLSAKPLSLATKKPRQPLAIVARIGKQERQISQDT